MKKVILIAIVLVYGSASKGQTFDEFFKQKKTQKKYLLEQIAAFQVYLNHIEKGYNIARNGLKTIGNIKNVDFKIHNNFFESFKRVNPVIRNSAKVSDITRMQLVMLQSYMATLKMVNANGVFNASEVRHISNVFRSLIEGCVANIDKLIGLTTANKLEMKDDERLRSIDSLYSDMKENYAFAQSFSSDLQLMCLVRLTEKDDVQTTRALHGIK